MISCHRVPQSNPDPLTGSRYQWVVDTGTGEIPWRGYTGPLRIGEEEFQQLCRALLGIEPEHLEAAARSGLRSVEATPQHIRLMLHSTTPNIKAFETDLASLSAGRIPLDLTTYTEARSLYLAHPKDVAVGRTLPWKDVAQSMPIEMLDLGTTDYYYLSHALLRTAHDTPQHPVMTRAIALLRHQPETVVSLYSLEPEMQVFLLWLGRQAGLQSINIDANHPQLGEAWNRKALLHPTVEQAQALEHRCVDKSPSERLAIESEAAAATGLLGLTLPVVPGYTLPACTDKSQFVSQVQTAAELLVRRHGVHEGCLKPSQGGDGGRIVPGIELMDGDRLRQLAEGAWQVGGDCLLEAHVHYRLIEIDGERVFTSPSSHVRGGDGGRWYYPTVQPW